MKFSDMILVCEGYDKELESVLHKCDVFSEANYVNYKKELAEIQLEYVNESLSFDELVYLEKEASEGFIVRAKKQLKKIIDSIIKWIKDKTKAVKDFFTTKKTKDALNNAEKIAKENPKLKNKKVKISDYKGKISEYEKIENKIDHKISIFKQGKGTEKDIDELDKLEEEIDRTRNGKIAIGTVITVTALLYMCNDYYKRFIKESTKAEASLASLASVSKSLEDSPEQMAEYLDAVRLKTEVVKESLVVFRDAIYEITNSIYSSLTGTGDVSVDNVPGIKPITENYSIRDEEYETMTEEEKNQYIDDIIMSINESYSDNNNFDTYSYLESVESQLIRKKLNATVNADEYLNNMELELFNESDDSFINSDRFNEDSYLTSILDDILDNM